MRLTLSLAGWTLDWTLEPTSEQADDSSLDGGTTASYPVGFTSRHDVPEEVPYQPHTPAWDEPEERA